MILKLKIKSFLKYDDRYKIKCECMFVCVVYYHQITKGCVCMHAKGCVCNHVPICIIFLNY